MSPPDTDTLVYAGTGARQTPDQTLDDMTKMAGWLAKNGWHLSSGGAHGADTAFAKGAPADQRSVFLPWNNYNNHAGPDCATLSPSQMKNCMDVAARLHPTWERCTDGVRRLHARNAAILLGPNLDRPVNAVVAWTPGGALKGGTGIGLRIAAEYNIPVLNLGTITPRQACEQLRNIQTAHLDTATAVTTASTLQQNPAAQDISADLKSLKDQDKQHDRQAAAAHIDPVLIPGRETLVQSARQLIEHPAAAELPAWDRMTLTDIIDNQQRHTDCIAEIATACTSFEESIYEHSRLEYASTTKNISISELPGYQDWINNAYDLSKLGQTMISENDVYDSAFTPDTWRSLTEHLADLDTAIGQDTAYLTNKELYLPPIDYDPSLSEKEQQAHAAYRALRDNWHDHIQESSYQYFYPLDYDNHEKHMRHAEKLILQEQHLPTESQQALRILYEDYTCYNHARQDIAHHLEATAAALREADSFIESFNKVHGLEVSPDDMNGYTEWRATSQTLLNDAENFTVAGSVYYDRYLEHNAEIRSDLQTAMISLHDKMEHFSPCDTPRIDQAESHYQQLEQEQTVSRGMTM